MVPERHEIGWAFAGNVIVAIGAGTLTVAAFVPSLPTGSSSGGDFVVRSILAAFGFAIFFWGYHVTQEGTYRDPTESLWETVLPVTGPPGGGDRASVVQPVRVGAVVAGAFFLGAGVRLFAMTVQTWEPGLGVVAGTATAVGYICAHLGINGVLL